ncbi:glycosyltransferase family 39 protein [Natronomonas salina]|uniref:ArnT family glycosyltransferase n=1 Tax=Natronomonas salina TaxID=1710540 RepID=UPI0015B60CBF|nr:glycosyltransferase family 39 protein [Natronomonas salina]QLD88685.1 glycosyltransferase family 39 protein [Natronomonas salina]
MSTQSRLQRFLSTDNIDLTLAKLGIVFCLLLLGLRLFASQVLLLVIPLAAGTACTIYVATRRRRSRALAFPALPGGVIGYFPAFVFLGLAVIVAGIRIAGHRTGVVYLLTGLVGALILVQILLAEDGRIAPGQVLFQILVAAVVIRMSVLFMTPGYIGVDGWTHIPNLVASIAESGTIASMEGTKYILAPFYHAIGAVGATVFGTPRAGTYLTVGLLIPLSSMLVYGTAKLLIPARWALLATALYAFSDQFIRWGIHVIPTGLGLVFFLGTLYCVTKVFFTDDRRIVALMLLFSLATIFTHQVSTAIVLVLLGIAAFVSASLSVTGNRPADATANSTPALVGTFGISVVVTLVTWAVTPWSGGSIFLWRMLDFLWMTLTESAGFLNLAGGSGGTPEAGRAGQTTGLIAELIPYIEEFGFALLLLITVLGGLVMLRKDEPTDIAMTYILTAGVMFVIVFGLTLFGIRTLLPGRWNAFMYAPMAIIGAVGLYYISQNASRKVILAVFVLLAFGYPTTMVITEKATLDSPAFDDEYPRLSYSEAEIAAVETAAVIHPPGTTEEIRTDHPYQTIYDRYGGFNSEPAVLNEQGPINDAPTVYRDYQRTAPAVVQEEGDPPTNRRTNSFSGPSQICPETRNHVYGNSDVKICTASPVTGGGDA